MSNGFGPKILLHASNEMDSNVFPCSMIMIQMHEHKIGKSISDKMATKSENGFIWLIVECIRIIEASLKPLTNSIETSNCIGLFG